MASFVQMNNAIRESADNQKSEMAELWKNVKKSDKGYEQSMSLL